MSYTRFFLARHVRRVIRCFSVLVLLVLAGCAYPTRNQEAKIIDETYGYRWGNLETSGAENTLVVVSASGGGTRAAALTLSVLRGLDMIALPNGKTLAQEVDLVSSVSGGSVTAAYFALKGPDGFDVIERDFIRKDGMTPLIAAAVNPLGLASLATPKKERVDLLIDYLDEQLFKGATYQTLLDIRQRPYLVLNAADMVEGVPFAFTQRKMDLLCSDLSQISLSTAVAGRIPSSALAGDFNQLLTVRGSGGQALATCLGGG
ncbi:MAG: hypothetical protein USCGTAYLOR_02448 [Chromatiales bacterium USCg_Taylor]|nr:MAG: hypothetical protein USCGTAYLOR_02448 [Chromatiales bacterium USCg_Taylor]